VTREAEGGLLVERKVFGEGAQRVIVTGTALGSDAPLCGQYHSNVAWEVLASSPGPSREVSPGPGSRVFDLESAESWEADDSEDT